jgi:prepilin-type N-terminal cleavage/methylation domain-containing protein
MDLKHNKGFTIIELLVVIAVIGLLASIVLVSVDHGKKKARDARRLSDMRQILLALELYYDSNGHYPGNTDNDCGGWDAGFNGGPGSGDPFIRPLKDGGFIETPGDPTATGKCGGYAYYRYGPGSGGCDPSRGAFFVLGIRDLETFTKDPNHPEIGHPESPGWCCNPEIRNWQKEFDWVTGGFEK